MGLAKAVSTVVGGAAGVGVLLVAEQYWHFIGQRRYDLNDAQPMLHGG